MALGAATFPAWHTHTHTQGTEQRTEAYRWAGRGKLRPGWLASVSEVWLASLDLCCRHLPRWEQGDSGTGLFREGG